MIGDPNFQFHLSRNERFIPSRGERWWPSKSTRPQSHPCAAFTGHSAASSHLKVFEKKKLVLHDSQFLLNQLSCITFVLESLHYLLWDLLSCLLFFFEPFVHLGTNFSGERHEQSQDFCTAFVRVFWTRVALDFKPTHGFLRCGLGN